MIRTQVHPAGFYVRRRSTGLLPPARATAASLPGARPLRRTSCMWCPPG